MAEMNSVLGRTLKDRGDDGVIVSQKGRRFSKVLKHRLKPWIDSDQ